MTTADSDALGFWAIADADPNRPALITPSGDTYTYGELDERANRVANGLRALHLRRGDGVAIVLPNEVEFLELYLAAMQTGLYLTCINFHLTGPEIAYIVSDCEADALVVHERYATAATAAAEELELPAERRFAVGAIDGHRSYQDIAAGQSGERPADRSSGTTMLYTSGTTGRPTGVRRPLPEAYPNEAAAAGSMLSMLFDIVPGPGAHLVAGPLYHAAPPGLRRPVDARGGAAPDPGARDHHQPHGPHHVPPAAAAARGRAVAPRHVVVAVGHPCGGAVPGRGQAQDDRVEGTGHLRVLRGHRGRWRLRQAARLAGPPRQPFPGAEIKIFDDDGNELPAGEVGIVYMGSPGRATFEYFKDEEKTKANRRGGLFTVGDMGYLDEDGWLFLSDRRADMIISGGVNIYPAEIEGGGYCSSTRPLPTRPCWACPTTSGASR